MSEAVADDNEPDPIRLPWPAWASQVIAAALLADEVEVHVLRALGGWAPAPAHVERLEMALVTLDPRHARGAVALALRLASDDGGVCRASATALALIALVAQSYEEQGVEAEPDPDDEAPHPMTPGSLADASPVDVERTAYDGHGAVVLAVETAPDDAEADPRAALRYAISSPAVLPRVADFGRDVLAGSLGPRQVAKRLTQLADRVSGLSPGTVDVDANGRLFVGGRSVHWRRVRRAGRTDRCQASLNTRCGRLILGLVVGDRPAAVASEISSQARVALMRLGVRLTSTLRLEPALRPSPRALRAWRLLHTELPAECKPRSRAARKKAKS